MARPPDRTYRFELRLAGRVNSLGVPFLVCAGASVGVGATVFGSVLFDGAAVGEGAVVRDSILGRGAIVAPGAELHDAVIGDEAYIGVGNELARGIRVWPGTRLEPTSVRFSSDV